MNKTHHSTSLLVCLLILGLSSLSLQAQSVLAFELMDANSNLPIRILNDGDVIDVNTDGNALNIRAEAPGVGSVQFTLSGTESSSRTETAAPYALFGDVSGNYNAWNPSLGAYTLSAQAFSGPGGSGTPGPVLTINFTVLTSAAGSVGGGEFLESAGLVVMETETLPVVGNWSYQTTIPGFSGSSYIEWKTGDPFGGVIPGGTDILTYEIRISTPGRYRIQIRSSSENTSEHNDVWMRLPDNGAIREKIGVFTNLGNGWFKVYQNSGSNIWSWNTWTVDGNPHNIFTEFPEAGVYKLELSGRSTKYKIDRIILYDSTNTTAFSINLARPQSERNLIVLGIDSAQTDQDMPVTLNVLANDLSSGGVIDTASLVVLGVPGNGTAGVQPDGTIQYTPNPGFTGTDFFFYQLCNTLGACAVAPVTVVVNEVMVPVILEPQTDSAATDQGMAVVIDVLSNDLASGSAIDSASLSIVQAPAQGMAEVGLDARITYSPDSAFFGVDSLRYSICNVIGSCAEALVIISVAEAVVPAVLEPQTDSAATDQGMAVVIDVLSNDLASGSAIDSASLSIVQAPAQGMAEVGLDARITYTPDSAFFGVDSLRYSICNVLGTCAEALVIISVAEVVPEPVCEVPSGLGVDILSSTSARVFWASSALAENFNLQGRRAGGPWVNRFSSDTSLTFGIFRPGFTYEFRVRAACDGAAVITDFSGIFGFTMPASRENIDQVSSWQLGPNPASASDGDRWLCWKEQTRPGWLLKPGT
jgi:hypothetical protein